MSEAKCAQVGEAALSRVADCPARGLLCSRLAPEHSDYVSGANYAAGPKHSRYAPVKREIGVAVRLITNCGSFTNRRAKRAGWDWNGDSLGLSQIANQVLFPPGFCSVQVESDCKLEWYWFGLGVSRGWKWDYGLLLHSCLGVALGLALVSLDICSQSNAFFYGRVKVSFTAASGYGRLPLMSETENKSNQSVEATLSVR